MPGRALTVPAASGPAELSVRQIPGSTRSQHQRQERPQDRSPSGPIVAAGALADHISTSLPLIPLYWQSKNQAH